MKLLWTLAVTMVTGLCAFASSGAQDNPFQGIRSFDYQNRQAVDAVHARIVAAGRDAAKLAQIETQLISVIGDRTATFAAKQEVCRFLGQMGTSRSVPALSGMLAGDQKEADAARYAIERIPGPEASTALRAALGKSSGTKRIGIANSLGVRRDAKAVPALAALLKSSDPTLRNAAAYALARIGNTEALAALRTLPKNDPAAAQALLRGAAAQAASGKASEAARVYLSLTAQGRPAVVRVTALRALASMKHRSAASVALKLMAEPDEYIQRGAAAACAAMTDPTATKAAIGALPKLPSAAQSVLLYGWAERKAPLAAATAIKFAANASGEVRAAAIRAAARCGGVQSVPTLAAIAGSSDAESGLAREALAQIPGQAAAQAIIRHSAEGAPAVRAAMMAVLTERPGKPSMTALMNGAKARDTGVATAALKGLAAVGGKDEVPPLASLLVGTQDDAVRDGAARAVVACVQRSGERESAVEPVVSALGSAPVSAKVTLLGVLAEVGGDRALAELTAAASSSDAEIKRAAVLGLAETWSDSSALPALMKLATTEEQRSLRVIALRGYTRLAAQDGGMSADDKVSRLEEVIKAAERPDEKRQALGALRDCRIERAASVAAALLGDRDLQADAAETILDLAAPQKRNNRDLPPVKGAAVTAALDKIIRTAGDAGLKERASKLK